MTLFLLARRNLTRQWLRNLLTIAGAAAATLTFLLIRTVLSMWTMSEEYTAQNRIATRHKATYVMTLPVRYVDTVAHTAGVTAAVPMNWFGGRLPGREQEHFATMATDASTLFSVYNEMTLPDEQRDNWQQHTQGAIVGEILAKKYGWRIGDNVTLTGSIYPGDWTFTIEGIYSASRPTLDRSVFYFHWRRLNEEARSEMKDQVGWIISRVDRSADVDAVLKSIDRTFDTESTQTLSTGEYALSASFFGMMSAVLRALDVISIVIAAVMLLIMGNALVISVRERVHDYGIMRALGFSPEAVLGVVLIEASLVGLLGAGAGLLVTVPLINRAIGPAIELMFAGWFPFFRVQASDMVIALVIAVLGACVITLGPGLRAVRMSVHDALQAVG